MEKLFIDKKVLDRACVDKLKLSNEIMMENAAYGMALFIRKLIKKRNIKLPKILICCGCGDNGADGLACARLLKSYRGLKVCIYEFSPPKSELCKIQKERCTNLKLEFVKGLDDSEFDILVDCVFGGGFVNRKADKQLKYFSTAFNNTSAIKIACDTPTALNTDSSTKVDFTLSMGALSLSLYTDKAKDFVGKVKVIPIGLERDMYEKIKTPYYLLSKGDLRLPVRRVYDVNKGDFGHVCVVSGEMIGASAFSAKAALEFGAGVVSVYDLNNQVMKYPELIYVNSIPKRCNVLCVGMGLGERNFNMCREILEKALEMGVSCVMDADIFQMPNLSYILDSFHSSQHSKLVLTPHPKELLHLLKHMKIDHNGGEYLEGERVFEVALKIGRVYPKFVFVLKNTNTVIVHGGHVYINPLGKPSLAKAGSGDVLAGLIASLMAQGRGILNSSISASISHCLSSDVNSTYSITPHKLIKNIAKLEKKYKTRV